MKSVAGIGWSLSFQGRIGFLTYPRHRVKSVSHPLGLGFLSTLPAKRSIKSLIPAIRFMSRLLIQRSASGTQEILLKPGANRLGRSEQNDLPINDPTVSGFHCEIAFEQDTVIVRDLGSTNGTFINSVPIRQAILEPGQTLRLGNVELFFPADARTPPTTVSGPLPSGARVRLAKADTNQPPPPISVTPVAVEPPLAPHMRGPD